METGNEAKRALQLPAMYYPALIDADTLLAYIRLLQRGSRLVLSIHVDQSSLSTNDELASLH